MLLWSVKRGGLETCTVESCCVAFGFASKHPVMLPTYIVGSKGDKKFVAFSQSESWTSKLGLGQTPDKGDHWNKAVTQVKAECQKRMTDTRRLSLQQHLKGGKAGEAAAHKLDKSCNDCGVKDSESESGDNDDDHHEEAEEDPAAHLLVRDESLEPPCRCGNIVTVCGACGLGYIQREQMAKESPLPPKYFQARRPCIHFTLKIKLNLGRKNNQQINISGSRHLQF